MRLLMKRYLVVALSILFIIYALIRCSWDKKYEMKNDRVYYKKTCNALGIIENIQYKNLNYEIILRKPKIYFEDKMLKPKGIVLVTDRLLPELKHGMKLKLKGELYSFNRAGNPGEFDSRSYNYTRNIDYEIKNPIFISRSNDYNYLKSFFYSMKHKCKENIIKSDLSKDKKTSSIINTMLLSEKSDLDKDLNKLYQENGISHILSISGLHVWLIGGCFYKGFRKTGLPLKPSCFLASLFLTMYILMIGFHISAFRAYIMFLFFFFSLWLKRTYHMLTACSLALILSLIINYRFIIHPGFLLSYSAVYSIILIFPALSGIIKNKFLNKYGFTMSLSLQLGMLPIVSCLFYEFSPYALVLNILAVPCVFPILLLGILTCIIGFLSYTISGFFLSLSSFLLHFIHYLMELVSGLPFSRLIVGKPQILAIVLYYFILILILFISRYSDKKRRILSIGILSMFFVLMYKNRTDLVITILDIGQGDAIVIEIKDKAVVLIDGGSSSKTDGGARVLEGFLKYKGYDSVNLHILTHSDKDHVLGIKNMIKKGYPVDSFVLPKVMNKDKAYIEFEGLLDKKKTAYIGKSDRIRIDEAEFVCYNPVKDVNYEKSNEYSTVLCLNYKGFKALFTGDLEGEGERLVVEDSLPDIDVLKVAHHGSKNSTRDDFLNQVCAEYAMISCGRNNSYGHPHRELLERLEKRKIKIYRTDRNGAITIKTDGRTIVFKTYN